MNQKLLGLKLSKLLLFFFLKVLFYGYPKLRHCYSGIAKSGVIFSKAFYFSRKELSNVFGDGVNIRGCQH